MQFVSPAPTGQTQVDDDREFGQDPSATQLTGVVGDRLEPQHVFTFGLVAMVVHAVSTGQADGHLVSLWFEVADDRDLPEAARSGDGRMSWRVRARHRLPEPERPVDRAGDGDNWWPGRER